MITFPKVYKAGFNLSGIVFTYVNQSGKRSMIIDGSFIPLKPGFSGWLV